MLSLYWFALGFGGIFLVVTVFLGHDSDADTGDAGSPDLHDITTGDITTGDVTHAGAGAHGHMGEATHPPMMDIFFFLLSLRFWAFFTAFFGLTGVGGSYLIGGGVSTFVMAIIMGAVAGFSASWLFKALSRGNVSTDINLAETVGSRAEVSIPIAPGDPGKVRLVFKGQLVECKAVCEDAELPLRTPVVIAAYHDNTFVVKPLSAPAAADSGKEESNP